MTLSPTDPLDRQDPRELWIPKDTQVEQSISRYRDRPFLRPLADFHSAGPGHGVETAGLRTTNSKAVRAGKGLE